MMMMGGVALIACLIPLVAVGILAVAVIGSVTGRSPDLLRRVLPPGILPDREQTGASVGKEPDRQAGSQQRAAGHARKLGYVRTCHECGTQIDRKWDYCPSCGAKLYWE